MVRIRVIGAAIQQARFFILDIALHHETPAPCRCVSDR
jgi:hypothetical protein